MLLLDDDDELPPFPEMEEQALAADLGAEGLNKIDEAIVACSKSSWLKVARVIADAIKFGDFSYSDAAIDLHVRRVTKIVASGMLEARGDLKKPRFSEVRLPNS